MINNPDRAISLVGLLLAVILFIISTITNGKLSDLLINLSASMVIVTLTVIFIDKLRELNILHKKKRALDSAFAQIKSANIGITMTLTLSSIRPIGEFQSEFVKAGEEANNANPKAFDEFWLKYARKLGELNNKQMLKHQLEDKLGLIKNTVDSLESSLISTMNLYEFAFDIETRSLIVEMITKATLFKSSFSIAEMDDYKKIIDVEPKFIAAIGAVDYIQAYNKFLDHISTKSS